MKPNYRLLAVLCMALSVPFIYYLANRNEATPTVRVATFNLALHRKAEGELLAELRGGASKPAKQLAEIIQRHQIDVLLLNELDRDKAAEAAEVFAREYLAVSQNGAAPIDYAFSFCGPVNTGEPSGKDLNGDGKVEGPQDAFGYGEFPGQYGMAVLSRYPILKDRVRTFQKLKWSAMPNALRPEGYYADDVWQHLRLSSKSHWDVPIGIGSRKDGFVLHALCSHPTPPSFDGPEDRNGCRNHDEIRFWVDYLTPEASSWIVDDAGVAGGLAAAARFLVMGDLNCDPVDGDSRRDAIRALIDHQLVQDVEPRSEGGVEQKLRQFGANMTQQGDPGLDTGDFDDTVGEGPGNLRVDYVLPAKSLKVLAAGVHWPKSHQPRLQLAEVSDHRLVWVELAAK
tara:strand:+ start:49483 stop:50676 length:1194 start_codon:yes stop_codon:yes gene_type:complete